MFKQEDEMKDVVERIRDRIHDLPMETEHLLDEAADEIERLREQELRMRCLEMAMRSRAQMPPEDIISVAQKMYYFAIGMVSIKPSPVAGVAA